MRGTLIRGTLIRGTLKRSGVAYMLRVTALFSGQCWYSISIFAGVNFDGIS